MTLAEKFNIPKDTVFNERCRTIVNHLGFEKVASVVPFTKEELTKAYRKDVNLMGSLPIKRWDYAAGFIVANDKRQGTQRVTQHNERSLLHYIPRDVDCITLSECIGILKQCAVMIVQESHTSFFSS